MFTIVSTLCSKDSVWSYADTETWSVSQLLNDNDDFIINVVEIAAVVPVVYSVRRKEVVEYLDTPQRRLSSVSNAIRTLPATYVNENNFEIDFSNVRHLKYRDVGDMDIVFEPASFYFGVENDVPHGTKTDIIVDTTQRSLLTKETINNRCLFTMDGTIREHTVINDMLYIRNIRESITDTSVFGILDFSEFESVSIHKITTDNTRLALRTVGEGSAFRTDFAVKLPVDVTNKSVMVVSGGYLHFNDSTYSKLSSDVVKVEVLHSLAIKRMLRRPLHERQRYCNFEADLSSVSRHRFTAEKYLTAGDSYVIVFDNNDVIRLKTLLTATGLPGSYEFSRLPGGVIFSEDGRIFEYRVTETTRGGYSIISTVPRLVEQNIDKTITPARDTIAVVGGIDTNERKQIPAYHCDFYHLR